MEALLVLVTLLLGPTANPPDAGEAKITDGVPTAEAVLARLSEGPTRPRAFEATWQERSTSSRPARVAWRVQATATELQLETFDMSAVTQTRARYASEARDGVLPLAEAPAWLRWIHGAQPRDIVQGLGLDAAQVALDVDERAVLWVLGARAAQGDRPQVRILRKTGALRRLVERRDTPAGPALLDVSVYYQATDGDRPWLPGRLIVGQGKDRVILHLIESPPEGPPTEAVP